MNLEEKIVWAIFDSNIVLEGIKTDNEYFSLDILFKSSEAFTFRIIITNREIIILDISFLMLILESNKLTIDQFKQEKNKIKDNLIKKKELALYFQAGNKIINYYKSFDLLVNELINLKCFKDQNKEEEIINVEQINKNDKNKIYDIKEIDDIDNLKIGV